MNTKFQGGLTNPELAAKWAEKLPGVTPSPSELTAFALGVEVGCELAAAKQGESSRPDLLEKLTYHAHERDDLTLDEVLTALASGWKKVRGRDERAMLLQMLSLMATHPAPVQEGWKLVPVEPTDYMRSHGAEAYVDTDNGADFVDIAGVIYRAMLAAAPKGSEG